MHNQYHVKREKWNFENAKESPLFLMISYSVYFRRENDRICREFQKIERVALRAPASTREMIELGEYMLDVKNHQMVALNVI